MCCLIKCAFEKGQYLAPVGFKLLNKWKIKGWNVKSQKPSQKSLGSSSARETWGEEKVEQEPQCWQKN